MKKIGFLLLTLIFSPLSYALDAKGTIDEIKICGTGHTKTPRWIRTLQFKIDNKWFGTYSEYHNRDSSDYDNDQTTSLLMMAYAQNSIVEIRATDRWSDNHNKCGITEGGVFHDNAGDYIKLAR